MTKHTATTRSKRFRHKKNYKKHQPQVVKLFFIVKSVYTKNCCLIEIIVCRDGSIMILFTANNIRKEFTSFCNSHPEDETIFLYEHETEPCFNRANLAQHSYVITSSSVLNLAVGKLCPRVLLSKSSFCDLVNLSV